MIITFISQTTQFNESLHFVPSNYRFSPTRTPSPWDGIRKSDKFSAVCPQQLPNIQNEQEALKKMPKGRLEYLKRLLPFLQNQSEDCLYLNVFSPLHGKPELFGGMQLQLSLTFNHSVLFHSHSGCTREETASASFHSWRIVRVEFWKSLRWHRAG